MNFVMPTVAKSNLLVLKGLRAEDFAEKISIFESKIPIADTATELSYNEVPAKFTSAESWSQVRSNRLCWMCGLPPTSYPKFVPENPRVESGDDVCDVKTHFCEWTCVSRYVRREYSLARIPDIMQTVCLFESKFSGRLRTVIPEGLPHTLMKPYSGNCGLTPAQYREKNAAIYRDNDLSTVKIEHLPSRVVKAGRDLRK